MSDLEMAALHGWITGDGQAGRGAFNEQLAQSGDAGGLAMLMYAAFVIVMSSVPFACVLTPSQVAVAAAGGRPRTRR